MSQLAIWTEQLPPEWKWNPTNYVSGTHEFVVNTAECALELFDDVIVYYDGPTCTCNGVYYVPRSTYNKEDVVLSCNNAPPEKGKYNIMWCNWHHARDTDYEEFDERIVQSPYFQSVFGSNSRIVPPACWPEMYKDGVKKPGTCLYSSSPDRGLDFLKSIWDEVEGETGARLIVTYDGRTEEEMEELYRSSQFWLHPCDGIELYCISALKAQAAKCIPVIIPKMALETTVKYGIRTNKRRFKDDLIKAIKIPPEPEDIHIQDWNEVTKELFKNI